MGGPQPSLCELTKKHSMTKSASSNYFSSLPLFFIADLLEFMCFYGRIVWIETGKCNDELVEALESVANLISVVTSVFLAFYISM